MAQKLPQKDVVIIGFGWTGAVMAYKFTGAGLDVVAIERRAWRDTATGGRNFAGAVTQGWRAYDITSDLISGLGAWSGAEISAHLHAGHVAGHGSAGDPMAEQVDDSLGALSPSDISAIVTYLRSIPAIRTPDLPAPTATPATDLPKVMQARFDPLGKQNCGGACASCHGWSGVSPLNSIANLTGSRAVNDRNATIAVAIVISGKGRETVDGVMFMPAFAIAYSDTEIAAVANYVTARFGAAPTRLTANEVTALRRSFLQWRYQ